MKRETLDKLHDAADSIRHIGQDLAHLAGAFHEVGNNSVAKRLCAMSDAISAASEAVNQGAGEAINDACRASEEATANLMTGVFLMATKLDEAQRSPQENASE